MTKDIFQIKSKIMKMDSNPEKRTIFNHRLSLDYCSLEYIQSPALHHSRQALENNIKLRTVPLFNPSISRTTQFKLEGNLWYFPLRRPPDSVVGRVGSSRTELATIKLFTLNLHKKSIKSDYQIGRKIIYLLQIFIYWWMEWN